MKLLKDNLSANKLHNFNKCKNFNKFIITSIPNFSSFRFESSNTSFIKELEASDTNQFMVFDDDMGSYVQLQSLNSLRYGSLDSLPMAFVHNDTMIPLAIINTLREKLNSTIDVGSCDVIKIGYIPKVNAKNDSNNDVARKDNYMENIPTVLSNSNIENIKIIEDLKLRKYRNTRENIIENFKNPLTSFENFMQFTETPSIEKESISALSILNLISFVYDNIHPMICKIPQLIDDNYKCYMALAESYSNCILNSFISKYVDICTISSEKAWSNYEVSIATTNIIYEFAIHRNFINLFTMIKDIIENYVRDNGNLEEYDDANSVDSVRYNRIDDGGYLELNNLLTRTDIKTAIIELIKAKDSSQFNTMAENISLSLTNLMIWRIINHLPNYSFKEISSSNMMRTKLGGDLLFKDSDTETFHTANSTTNLSSYSECIEYANNALDTNKTTAEKTIKLERGDIDEGLYDEIMQFVNYMRN